MRKLPVFFVISAISTLGACNPSEAPTKTAEVPGAPSAVSTASAPAQKVWKSDMAGTDGRARLVYAEPGSSEYSLKFECPANGPVYVFIGNKPPADASVFPFVLGTSSGTMPINGGVYDGVVEATVPSGSFTNIRNTGTVSVAEPGKEPILMDASTPEERALFDQFFKMCGA